MDTDGGKGVVESILLNKKMGFDVTFILTDADASITAECEKHKKSLMANKRMCRNNPQLNDCSPTIARDYCLGHIKKHLIKQLRNCLTEWKHDQNLSRMPAGLNVENVTKYFSVAFSFVLSTFANYKERKIGLKHLFDHLRENSEHDSELCTLRKCQEKDDHFSLPDSLIDKLNSTFIKYIDRTVIKNMTMMTTTNRCEGANKSITKLLPKNIFHRDIRVIIAYVILTLLKLNFGKIVLLYVLLELGIPEICIPIGLIQRWQKQKEKMQAQRYRNTKPDKKERKKYRKSARKLDNQQRTKAFKATRRKKNDPKLRT